MDLELFKSRQISINEIFWAKLANGLATHCIEMSDMFIIAQFYSGNRLYVNVLHR